MDIKELMRAFVWFLVTMLIIIIAEIAVHFNLFDDYTIGYSAGALVIIAYYEILHRKDKR